MDDYLDISPIDGKPKTSNEPHLEALTIRELQQIQFEWLKSVGWVGKTTALEDLMLVVSECGEAANEVRGLQPTPDFSLELADIVLRVMGIAAKNNIDLQYAIKYKMNKNFQRGTRGRLK